MTPPDAGTDRDLLTATIRWCAELAAAVAELAPRVARLTDEVARDWPDDHGREWSERAALVHRELCRDAVTAAELGAAIARLAAGPLVLDPLSGPAAGTVRHPGVRLGGIDATRAGDDRGMTIAQLPDPGASEG